MVAKCVCCRCAAAVAVAAVLGFAVTEAREWTDKTGKHKVHAEFVTVRAGNVVLRRAGGKEIEVPIDRLSEADQEYIWSGQAEIEPHADLQQAGPEIKSTSIEFFEGLRADDREPARLTLTEKAQKLADAPHSPLALLPKPFPGDRSIVVGEPQLDGQVAEIPVRVRADGKFHKTKLHLRYEDAQWMIFAISATYPDGEKSIDFEAELAPQARPGSLSSLVGNQLDLSGYTVEGSPLDMSSFAGKVVLVDFWATWCGPCRAEMPNIAKNWAQYHDRGFDVIAISVDQDLGALKSFVTEEQPPWTVVADNHPRNSEKMSGKLGIQGIPAFILIGRDGKVAAVNCRGPLLGQQLEKLIGKS